MNVVIMLYGRRKYHWKIKMNKLQMHDKFELADNEKLFSNESLDFIIFTCTTNENSLISNEWELIFW